MFRFRLGSLARILKNLFCSQTSLMLDSEMGILQDSLKQTCSDVPRQLCRALVARKLAERDVVDAALVERVVESVMDGHTGGKEVELDLPFDIEFTDDDIADLDRSVDDLTEGFPELLDKMSAEFGRDLADDMRQKWKAKSVIVADEREAIRRRIASDWGEAFSDLRLLIELCSGYGHDFNEAQLQTNRKHNAVRNEVLSRLHIRACRIAEEIAILLDNGQTEGAEARWRTLHEVSVTALLVQAGGEQLARRYVDHQAVEQRKILDDHDRAISANSRPVQRFDAADRKAINAEFTRVTRRHGNSFRGMYGWVAGQLGISEQPQFHHLQEAAGVLATKLEYRLACFGTHASPRKLEQPMHKWDPTLHVSGTFAAGFENPGVNTAYTLVQVTTALFDEPWDLDKLVELRVLTCVRDDVEVAMNTVARGIAKREQRNMDRAIRRASVGPQRQRHFARGRR